MATPKAGNPYWKGRLSTIDLLVLTSLDQLFLYSQCYLHLLQNNDEVNCTEPSPSVSVPCHKLKNNALGPVLLNVLRQ